MICERIENKYSKLITDYLNETKQLEDFYAFKPKIEEFSKVIAQRTFSQQTRNVLHTVLKDRYSTIKTTVDVLQNIESLTEERTFTVCTGHQLSLFTGPLFFIYKLLSTIRLTEELKEKFPDQHFVPVYWMASEDHDFEEINHFHLFGKTYEWRSDQKGAVGEFTLDDLKGLLDEIPDEAEEFKAFYESSETLSEATFRLVNHLFGKYGIVVIEPGDARLKSEFKEVLTKELTEHKSEHNVSQTSSQLDKMEYKTQVTPREINLFYLEKGSRERIIEENGQYSVLNSNFNFSKKEILNIVENSPEILSPNVILRPMYQEVILPNLAYVGGPGELAYWLQLKSAFEGYNVQFPMLVLRDSFLVLGKGQVKTIEKFNLKNENLLLDYNELKKQVLSQLNEDEETTLEEEKKLISEALENIKPKLKDKSLDGAVDAEKARMLKSLDNLEKRIRKSEEKIHETSLNQLEKLYAKVFPTGIPQERYENILNYLINNADFIDEVYEHTDPFKTGLKILKS